ncbi:mycofactocin biosynthesis glycosyltransferase MftF [Arthrobacter gandavensis]|uniref:mycofactocin biosynthesis glycosyltransferase MftF n=1 Tax=Arthrobacter gandavensis TaxID=169960 RepID=UPI0018909B0A|nr:mycofactocin biosynthesis glycosyltransferase MftF [Arthrobacter gandavensis]MBF4993270.1 mycofactocin biosynthesis glycosyltransferase MftF [Arthrobacter gandavensis]
MSRPVGPPPAGLPDGFRVRLSPTVRVSRDRTVLSGGSPVRVLFPGAAARQLLAGPEIEVRNPVSRHLVDKLLGYGLANPVPDGIEAAAPDSITYVIPVRDRPESLDRLLVSIGSGKRVIVVDDASVDGDAVACTAASHGAEYVPLAVNVGPAGARNAGLRRVLTPLVVFIDSDVVLEPGTVDSLMRHFADPRVAAAAPRIRALETAPDGSRAAGGPGWIGRYEAARSSLDLGPASALVQPRGTVSWLPAACIVARVEALGPGFSDGLRVAEDVDLVWTLIRRGWRVRYDAAVAVRHDHRQAFGSWLARKAFYGSGAHELARRHGRNVAPAVLAPWSAAMLVALLAQRRWSVPAAACLAAATALRLGGKLKRAPRPLPFALRLTGQGVVASLGQGSALLLRHWWPVAAAGCVVSRRIRRAVLAAAAADVVVEYVRTRPDLDILRFGLARRLDDLAYGAGVWRGAVRGRSVSALMPEITGLRRR